jgi:K+-sensing histidine kinase KdpD
LRSLRVHGDQRADYANEATGQARAEGKKKKLRSDLLRAISHDFRTPLDFHYGAIATLFENSDQ